MIVKSPAVFALFIPFGLSSTAAHFLGGRFKLLQASLYISGSGFECETWSPVDNDSKNEMIVMIEAFNDGFYLILNI